MKPAPNGKPAGHWQMQVVAHFAKVGIFPPTQSSTLASTAERGTVSIAHAPARNLFPPSFRQWRLRPVQWWPATHYTAPVHGNKAVGHTPGKVQSPGSCGCYIACIKQPLVFQFQANVGHYFCQASIGLQQYTKIGIPLAEAFNNGCIVAGTFFYEARRA